MMTLLEANSRHFQFVFPHFSFCGEVDYSICLTVDQLPNVRSDFQKWDWHLAFRGSNVSSTFLVQPLPKKIYHEQMPKARPLLYIADSCVIGYNLQVSNIFSQPPFEEFVKLSLLNSSWWQNPHAPKGAVFGHKRLFFFLQKLWVKILCVLRTALALILFFNLSLFHHFFNVWSHFPKWVCH